MESKREKKRGLKGKKRGKGEKRGNCERENWTWSGICTHITSTCTCSRKPFIRNLSKLGLPRSIYAVMS